MNSTVKTFRNKYENGLTSKKSQIHELAYCSQDDGLPSPLNKEYNGVEDDEEEDSNLKVSAFSNSENVLSEQRFRSLKQK
jgi:hypothetical protein